MRMDFRIKSVPAPCSKCQSLSGVEDSEMLCMSIFVSTILCFSIIAIYNCKTLPKKMFFSKFASGCLRLA